MELLNVYCPACYCLLVVVDVNQLHFRFYFRNGHAGPEAGEKSLKE
jgi:hypothetical protein